MEVKFDGENRPIRRPHGNYAKWFIRWVVAELERGVERGDLLSKYKMHSRTLSEWVKKHASPAYKSRRKVHTAELKKSVVRAILQGRMSMDEAQAACDVASRKTIRAWIKDYTQQENVDLAVINQQELGKKKKSSAGLTTSQEQIKMLQQQLADEQLKVAALNTLIDVAEEQLKIDIRKKPGARQS